MLTRRECVRRIFRAGTPDRVPFLPCATLYAARLSQISVAELLEDPQLLANGLQSTAAWLSADAVVGPALPRVPIVECGWTDWEPQPEIVEQEGQISVVLEAFRRLKIVIGKETALVGGLTGPLATARCCDPKVDERLAAGDAGAAALLERAAKVVVRLARKYGELQLDGILVSEPELVGAPDQVREALLPHLRSVWKVTRFYDMGAILSVGRAAAALDWRGLGVTAVVGPAVEAWIPVEGTAVGAVLSSELMGGAANAMVAAVGDYMGRAAGVKTFLTTDGEISPQLPPESLRALAEALAR